MKSDHMAHQLKALRSDLVHSTRLSISTQNNNSVHRADRTNQYMQTTQKQSTIVTPTQICSDQTAMAGKTMIFRSVPLHVKQINRTRTTQSLPEVSEVRIMYKWRRFSHPDDSMDIIYEHR